jgi:hypothetical protein
MRFFRRRPGFGGLALIALAAQFILALGHTHAVGASPRWLTASPTVSIACRSFLPPTLDKPCPPRHSGEHDCPICWTASLAGSLVLHEPPALVLPSSRGEVLKVKPVTVTRFAETASAFDARGPPLSERG